MIKTRLCTIRLQSKSYTLKCPENEVENLQLAAQKLNDQLVQTKSASKRLDDYQILLLASLQVSHELISCQNQQNQQRQQLADFINTLESTVGVVSEEG